METLTERYTNYLNAKDEDMVLCEFLSYEEYNILYEDGYRDLETPKSKAIKYGAGVAAGIGAGAAVAGTGGAILLGPVFAAGIASILALYRTWTDKCNKRCAGLSKSQAGNGHHGPEFSLCKAKCNKQGAMESLTKLKTKRSAAIAKTPKEKKVKVNAKFDKLETFFQTKIQKFDQMIKDYEGAMRGRAGK